MENKDKLKIKIRKVVAFIKGRKQYRGCNKVFCFEDSPL
jgi:hypothetical protein